MVYLLNKIIRKNMDTNFMKPLVTKKIFNTVGEHMGSDHDCNLMVPFSGKTYRSECFGHNCLPMVSFGGETTEWLHLHANSYHSQGIHYPCSIFTIVACSVQEHRLNVPIKTKPPGSEGLNHNCLPVVSFSGETHGVVPFGGETTGSKSLLFNSCSIPCVSFKFKSFVHWKFQQHSDISPV
ncbi:hypothetical protein M5K25_001845 [Dendrobium thyrsiflorum]|uniref:Uncharacterized protein n=1 Tax=Dendrobium thyrsiflorum TaxID=117978 RepID=A0ABD0VSY1_DENTH